MKALLFIFALLLLFPNSSTAGELEDSYRICSPDGNMDVFKKKGRFEECVKIYKSGRYGPVTGLGYLYRFLPHAFLEANGGPIERTPDQQKIINQQFMKITIDSNIEAYAWLRAGIKSRCWGYFNQLEQKSKAISAAEGIKQMFTRQRQLEELEKAEKKAENYYKLYVLPSEHKCPPQ